MKLIATLIILVLGISGLSVSISRHKQIIPNDRVKKNYGNGYVAFWAWIIMIALYYYSGLLDIFLTLMCD